MAIHPPWRDGKAGTAALEFPIVLPAGGPIRLHFQNAVVDDGQGDGVTFRVRVAPIDAPEGQLGAVVFERHSAAKRWGTEGEADLSRYAGKAVRIQLESHPGPKNNTGWDQSFWSEPTLVAGNPPAEILFPPRDATGSVVLGTATCGKASTLVRLWPGSRGLLDTVIGFERGGSTVHVRGFHVRVLGSQIDDPRSPFALMNTQVDQTPGAYSVRHHFKGSDGTFDLVGSLEVIEGVVRAKFRLENGPPAASLARDLPGRRGAGLVQPGGPAGLRRFRQCGARPGPVHLELRRPSAFHVVCGAGFRQRAVAGASGRCAAGSSRGDAAGAALLDPRSARPDDDAHSGRDARSKPRGSGTT